MYTVSFEVNTIKTTIGTNSVDLVVEISIIITILDAVWSLTFIKIS